MYVLMREGSSAKDLRSLLPIVTPTNARRCLFCTDDKHLDDLLDEGSIDHHIRLAIEPGVKPEIAYQMASLNAAECYGLYEKGAIASGYDADFVLIEDLESVTIKEVYKNGERVAENGNYLRDRNEIIDADSRVSSSINMKNITEPDLQIPIGSDQKAHIIEIILNQINTKKIVETVPVLNGNFQPSVEADQLKLITAERHKRTGNVGRGIVKGFGIKVGAMATTVAHDSHNIVAVGTSDQDLQTAIQALEKMEGGLVIVKNGDVIASVPLSIAGLMSNHPSEDVYEQLQQLKKGVAEIGFKGPFNPFLTLSFLTLPVIPSLKLTDTGLFDVESFSHINVSL